MIDKKISNFEFFSLSYFITRALIIGTTFNALINILKQDSWIIPIISVIPAYILILLINYIIEYKPNLNFPQKVINLFNRKIGTIIIIIISMFIFLISLINFLNECNFIQSQFLNKTPLFIISILFMFTIFYIVKKGINTITRTANILFYIGFILLVLSFVGLLPAFKLDNLKPYFFSNTEDYFNGLNLFYSFNILPLLLLTIIPKNCFKNPKIKKTLFISYTISAISIFFIMFGTIATFGYELAKLYQYPEFFVLKHVCLINLSTRIESILIIQLIFDMFIFSLFCTYFLGNCIKVITKSKKLNIFYFMICLLSVVIVTYISKYNYFIDRIIIKYFTNFISTFITIIILTITFKIKMDKK